MTHPLSADGDVRALLEQWRKRADAVEGNGDYAIDIRVANNIRDCADELEAAALRRLGAPQDEEIARLKQEIRELRTLANIGTWHEDCRPNRHQAAREIEKSQEIINKLADRITELELEARRLGAPQDNDWQAIAAVYAQRVDSKAYRAMLDALTDAGVPIQIPSDSLPPHWQVAQIIIETLRESRRAYAGGPPLPPDDGNFYFCPMCKGVVRPAVSPLPAPLDRTET